MLLPDINSINNIPINQFDHTFQPLHHNTNMDLALAQLDPVSHYDGTTDSFDHHQFTSPIVDSTITVADNDITTATNWLGSNTQLVRSPISAHSPHSAHSGHSTNSINSVDGSWTFVTPSPPPDGSAGGQSFDSYHIPPDVFFSPTVLHLRSHSGSSQDGISSLNPYSSGNSIGSFEELTFPMSSPETGSYPDLSLSTINNQSLAVSTITQQQQHHQSVFPLTHTLSDDPVILDSTGLELAISNNNNNNNNTTNNRNGNIDSSHSQLALHSPQFQKSGFGYNSYHHTPANTNLHSSSSQSFHLVPTSTPAFTDANNLVINPGWDHAVSHHLHGHSHHHHHHSYSHIHSHPNQAAQLEPLVVPPPIIAPRITLPLVAPVQSTPLASSKLTSPSSDLQTTPPTTSRRRKTKTTPRAAVAKRKQPTQSPNTNSPPAPSSSPTEKRVGRRRGPLRPEQRQQAHEIRKLRACLRCKFLKKTCDPGDPCVGCQPTHARLWQVPCTRLDIRDIGTFLNSWSSDFKRPPGVEFPYDQIASVSPTERQIKVSHGYGIEMILGARYVLVSDPKPDFFDVAWMEKSGMAAQPSIRVQSTGKMCLGASGITPRVVHMYLDAILSEQFFPGWVDQYFEGTFFLTEMLKSLHRYYCKSQCPILAAALKMIIAYALTSHVSLITGLPESEMQAGLVRDPSSRAFGQTVSPVLINLQIKKAFAETWRVLMKEVLAHLSSLFSSVYNGDKLKNWPTIFMISILILALWELIQFDCHYRNPDVDDVATFCHSMESTPVGVIVGLFAAISHQVPSFSDWDTTKHKDILQSDDAICEVMTETRSHVEKYEGYLKNQQQAKFDVNDFDCLSNKFLSRIVIRAH